jgi:hypothetical protein
MGATCVRIGEPSFCKRASNDFFTLCLISAPNRHQEHQQVAVRAGKTSGLYIEFVRSRREDLSELRSANLAPHCEKARAGQGVAVIFSSSASSGCDRSRGSS